MRYISAFLLGAVSGTRSMLAPTVASWATQARRLNVDESPVSFLQRPGTAMLLATLASGELVGDKLPFMPDRKKPLPFLGRVAMGAIAGAAVGAGAKQLPQCALLGAAGAFLGTLAGSALRRGLSESLGRDFPAALLEDLAAACVVALALQQLDGHASSTVLQAAA